MEVGGEGGALLQAVRLHTQLYFLLCMWFCIKPCARVLVRVRVRVLVTGHACDVRKRR